jgi:hypothetical protein
MSRFNDPSVVLLPDSFCTLSVTCGFAPEMVDVDPPVELQLVQGVVPPSRQTS